jgi:hypothetical protein
MERLIKSKLLIIIHFIISRKEKINKISKNVQIFIHHLKDKPIADYFVYGADLKKKLFYFKSTKIIVHIIEIFKEE